MVLLLIDFNVFALRAPFRNMAAILNLDKGCTSSPNLQFLEHFSKRGGVKPMLKNTDFVMAF